MFLDYTKMAPVPDVTISDEQTTGVKAVLLGPPGSGKGTQVIQIAFFFYVLREPLK